MLFDTITGTFKTNLIAWLGESANGIEKIFTKELIATNGHFEDLAVSHQLCVDDDAGVTVCVTGTQLRSLLSGGSVLGASTPSPTEEAAGASSLVGDIDAPAGSSAPPQAGTDTTSTTTAANDSEPLPPATTTPEVSVPSEAAPAEVQPTEVPPAVAEQPAHAAELAIPEPANENSPADELPATGTE